MLAEYDEEFSKPDAGFDTDHASERQSAIRDLQSAELRSSRGQMPTDDLDWAQVVDLRRRASEIITDETEEHARSTWPSTR